MATRGSILPYCSVKKPTKPKVDDATSEQLAGIFRNWRDTNLRRELGWTESFPAIEARVALLLSLPLPKMGDNTCAGEWARPATNAVKLMRTAQFFLENYPKLQSKAAPEEFAHCKELAEQLDWALAMIVQEAKGLARHRAKRTRSMDLMLDCFCEACGDATEAVEQLQHIERSFPEASRSSDGTLDGENFVDKFVRDTYERVDALDRLVDEFPEHFRLTMPNLPAWPMLRHRHTASDSRFRELVERFRLGEDYPLDTSETARFRPDTPMVRYLYDLMDRLHHLWLRSQRFKDEKFTAEHLEHDWRYSKRFTVGRDLLAALDRLHGMPPLSKATAKRWAKEIVVPVIMATDAVDFRKCDDPALKQVARQNGVKSRATFKSRLAPAVAVKLRELARR